MHQRTKTSQEDNEDNDVHIKSAYEKVKIALNYKFSADEKYYLKDDFTNKILFVNFTHNQIRAINPNGEIKTRYEIVKKLFSGVCIDLYAEGNHYVLKPKKEVYEVVFNIINNDKDQYNDDFVKEVEKFDKCKEYLIKR